jgi:hypothetical protein
MARPGKPVPVATDTVVGDARLDRMRAAARLLDSRFRIPGTNIRFGLEGIVGLIPGVGDLASPLYTGALLVEGLRRRLPFVVQARMVLNSAIDMLMGLVPLLGDVVDIAWKANLRNLALLERHAARPNLPPTRGDYVFVAVCLGLLVLIMLVPIILLALVIAYFPRFV